MYCHYIKVVYAYVFRRRIQIVNLLIFAHAKQVDSDKAIQNLAGNLTSLKETISCKFTYNRDFNAAIEDSVTMIWRHILARCIGTSLHVQTLVSAEQIVTKFNVQFYICRHMQFFLRSESYMDSYMNASCISARICSELAKYLSERKMVLKKHCIEKRNLV